MSLTGAARTTRRASACRSATCSPGCTAHTASSPRCTSEPHRRGRVVRTSLLAVDRRRPRVPGHALHGRGRGARAQRQPPPVDRAVRRCSHARTPCSRSRCGSEGLWRTFAPIVGLDPADERFATQRTSGSRNRDRISSSRSTRRSPTGTSTSCWPGWPRRDAGRRGAHPRPGLRVGADPVAGPADRRRAPVLGRIELPGPPLRFDDAALPAAATSTSPRRPWASTTTPSSRGSTKTGTDRHGATGTAVGSRASSTCRCGASVRCEHRRAGEVRCG